MRLVDRIIRIRLLFFLGFVVVFVGLNVGVLLLTKLGRFTEVFLLCGSALVVLRGGFWLLNRCEAPLQRRLRELDFGLCPGCGYPTAGRPGPICPECGDRTPQSETRKAWEKRLGSWWPAVFDERR